MDSGCSSEAEEEPGTCLSSSYLCLLFLLSLSVLSLLSLISLPSLLCPPSLSLPTLSSKTSNTPSAPSRLASRCPSQTNYCIWSPGNGSLGNGGALSPGTGLENSHALVYLAQHPPACMESGPDVLWRSLLAQGSDNTTLHVFPSSSC